MPLMSQVQVPATHCGLQEHHASMPIPPGIPNMDDLTLVQKHVGQTAKVHEVEVPVELLYSGVDIEGIHWFSVDSGDAWIGGDRVVGVRDGQIVVDRILGE